MSDRWKLIFSVLFFVVGGIIYALLPTPSAEKMAKPVPALTAEEKAAHDRQLDECKSLLVRAAGAGFLRDIGKEGRSVRVAVLGQVWAAVDFQTKTGFARAVSCIVSGGDLTKAANINIYEHMNNRLVGRYASGVLTVP